MNVCFSEVEVKSIFVYSCIKIVDKNDKEKFFIRKRILGGQKNNKCLFQKEEIFYIQEFLKLCLWVIQVVVIDIQFK